MFHQVISPVADSLPASFLVALVPMAVVLLLLGVLRAPAWIASGAGLLTALPLAVLVWRLPLSNAVSSIAAGATFALWPVMWIVCNALVLYNVTVASGQFAAFRDWLLRYLPNDRRVVLVVIGFCFSCLLEGVAGFGTPIAITSALLIAMGIKPLDALVCTLIFNTAPVAFGALGSPITTLAAVTQIDAHRLAAMVGRQLPLIAVFLPFYVVAVYGGVKALRGVWPVLLVAGLSFAIAQFLCANYIGYELTDVVSSMASLIATLVFLRVWTPPVTPEFALDRGTGVDVGCTPRMSGRGWLPWVVLVAVVAVWTHLNISAFGQVKVEWPWLHDAVFITLYDRPYAAIWNFQPLATGTAIALAWLMVAMLARLSPRNLANVILRTLVQVRLPALTTTLIVALAYLLNYSGMTYTLGVGVASVGIFFPLASAFLGWFAVFLSGSDTSGNALFGNLQVVAARQLDLSPVLMAATNTSGGVMGKMISPQNIATGTSVTNLRGQEGRILARTFKHSLVLTFALSIIVMIQQWVTPWIIP